MPSPHFINLSRRLAYLRTTLPATMASPGGLTSAEIDSVAFCAVMAGAACEQYIEESSLRLADAAVAKFQTTGSLGRVGKHLCVFPFVEVKATADLRKMVAIYGGQGFDIRVSPPFLATNRASLANLLNIGYQKYKQQVVSNHGFALKYQFRLLSTIGADLSSLTPTFSSRVGQLATFRGEVAHTTVVAATTVPSPSDMSLWLGDLIVGFRTLDSTLMRLERRVY